MIQDAINTIASLMDRYPQVYTIQVTHVDDITVKWSNNDNYHENNFNSTVQMLEWLEETFK